jgi:hypothetical protein
MAQTRKIRVEYYLVVKVPKNVNSTSADKLFDLEKLIKKADGLTHQERTFDYYQEEARLDKLKYNKANNYWYLNFTRLRQTKIPSKAKKNSEAEPIKLATDEYIGEDVTALYDVENHIIALQRNRDSLSSTGIEQYLSSLYNSSIEDVYLRPISPKDIEKRIAKARIFRKITIKFACMPEAKLRGGQNTSSLGSFIKNFKVFDAKTAIITMSLGHSKTGSLDSQTIRETIDEIRENIGIISDAEISIKNSETDPVDTIDLFSMKSHDFISIKMEKLETIPFNSMAEKILIKYNKSKKILIESLK